MIHNLPPEPDLDLTEIIRKAEEVNRIQSYILQYAKESLGLVNNKEYQLEAGYNPYMQQLYFNLIFEHPATGIKLSWNYIKPQEQVKKELIELSKRLESSIRELVADKVENISIHSIEDLEFKEYELTLSIKTYIYLTPDVIQMLAILSKL